MEHGVYFSDQHKWLKGEVGSNLTCAIAGIIVSYRSQK
jgi:hypothetical protein